VPTNYDYSVAGDTATGEVEFRALLTELVDDPGIPFILGTDKVLVEDDLLRFIFDTALTSPEQIALDALVAAHPQQILEDENAGATGYNFTRTPGPNDDASIGIEVGDTWVANKQDVYICLDSTTGAAQWTFANQSGSSANEAPGRTCLGGLLDYPNAAGEGNAGDIQYTRVWLIEGTVIDRLEFFLDSQGSPAREVRVGIYDQLDPLDEATDPNTRVAQSNSEPTGPGLNGSFIQLHLTDAPTGGSGVDVNFVVPYTGWFWLAFIADNTVAKYAVTDTFRAEYLPVRRESGTGTLLPVTPSGLSNPVSAVILVCTIKEGVA
jgi:hypothetical protein